MKNQFLILFLVLTIQSKSYSQAKISNLKDECKTENAFPYIESGVTHLAAEKINTLLQVRLLEIVPDAYEKCAFEKVMYDSINCCSYISFYEYTIAKNSKTLLSFRIIGETMGAYPENASWEYNFNVITGDLISSEEIFTEKGYAKLKEKITFNRRKRVNDFLTNLNSSLDDNKDANELEYENNQRDIYERCLDYINEDDFFYGSFLIQNDKIIFIRERCSNHAMRALDDLDSFNDEVFVKDVYNDLNEYGKALFSEDVESVQHMETSLKYNKILKGTINGKNAITCIFNKPYLDNSLSLYYWYDNHKTIIKWSGKLNGTRLELIENDHHDEKLKKWIPRALIEAEINQNSIIGLWKDQKTGRNLPLKLIKY
ncbi:MAG: hypothetical protein K0R51_852 [Cytophagaceae bacterium]|jgi:hypothetical protein|nr:hypothetical protein [Cytophagaceae bacterium]